MAIERTFDERSVRISKFAKFLSKGGPKGPKGDIKFSLSKDSLISLFSFQTILFIIQILVKKPGLRSKFSAKFDLLREHGSIATSDFTQRTWIPFYLWQTITWKTKGHFTR